MYVCRSDQILYLHFEVKHFFVLIKEEPVESYEIIKEIFV